MSVYEVKRLFTMEFERFNMTGNEKRREWFNFIGNLFDNGSINARVFRKCERAYR